MITDSTFSISFYSHMLNDSKYNLLKGKGELIREFKNELSEKLTDDPLIAVNHTKEQLTTLFKCQIEGLVGREIQQAIRDVYTKYDNKIKSFKQNIKCNVQKEQVLERYQRNTKNNKKGDVKKFYIKKVKTPLTKAVEHLTKYYYPGYVNYMINEINNGSNNKTYANAIHYINIYGSRLIKLCLDKQKRVRKLAFNKPIYFKTLTYSAVNNLKLIVDKNPNEDSLISHHILLSGFKKITDSGKLVVPIKYNEEYHEDINDFNKNQPTYTVQFVKDEVRFILTKKGQRNYKGDGSNTLGIDGNVKHNLFAMSDDEESNIDFDRELVKNYVQLKLKMDKKHELLYKTDDKDLSPEDYKQKYKLIERDQKFQRKLKAHYNYLAYELIKYAKENKYDHLVVEDLLFKEKSHIRSEEFYNMKFSRLVRILHLSDFKSILSNQCCSKDMQLTIVNPAYTSQRCSNEGCGYVHKDNRKTQEDFKCLKCSYSVNADYNASRNIKQITEIEVLNRSLLTYDRITSWLVPKKGLTRQRIKQIYDEYHDSCQDSCQDAHK